MSEFGLQVGENRVLINGTQAFVVHMQRVVVRALQDAPLGAASAPAAPKRRAKRAAAKKGVAKTSVNRSGRKPGRLPGRTVNGKYIKPGAAIPKGYREATPGGKILPAAAPAK